MNSRSLKLAIAGISALLLTFALASSLSNRNPEKPGPKNAVVVRYLSDVPGSTYEALEKKQKQAYGPHRGPNDKATLLKFLENSPKREGWEDSTGLIKSATAGIQVPTRYQDLAAYVILNRMATDIRSALPANQAHRVDLIDWGTLPTMEINASARKFGPRYLITFDEGVFPALYALLLTVDRTVSFREVGDELAIDFSPEAMQKEIQRNPAILNNYVDIVVAFAKGAELPQLEFASEREAATLMRQLNAAERFLVGHEFGHVIENHTEARLVELNANPSRGAAFTFTRFGRDWITELTADATGQTLAAKARKVDESGSAAGSVPLFEGMAAYAPSLFFELFEAIEDASFCDGSGVGSSRTLGEDAVDAAYKQISAALAQDQSNAELSNVELGCRQKDHPPAWLRARLLTAKVDARFAASQQRSSVEIEYARSLLKNARMLADLAAPRIKAKLND